MRESYDFRLAAAKKLAERLRSAFPTVGERLICEIASALVIRGKHKLVDFDGSFCLTESEYSEAHRLGICMRYLYSLPGASLVNAVEAAIKAAPLVVVAQ